MRHAVGFAHHCIFRGEVPVERLDLAWARRLTFDAPNEGCWPAPCLAQRTMEDGGLARAVLNAAKERPLDLFLERRPSFPGMAVVVERLVDRAAREVGMPRPLGAAPDLGDVLGADRSARSWVEDAGRDVEA